MVLIYTMTPSEVNHRPLPQALVAGQQLMLPMLAGAN